MTTRQRIVLESIYHGIYNWFVDESKQFKSFDEISHESEDQSPTTQYRFHKYEDFKVWWDQVANGELVLIGDCLKCGTDIFMEKAKSPCCRKPYGDMHIVMDNRKKEFIVNTYCGECSGYKKDGAIVDTGINPVPKYCAMCGKLSMDIELPLVISVRSLMCNVFISLLACSGSCQERAHRHLKFVYGKGSACNSCFVRNDKYKLKKCGKCGRAKYCSALCQRKHWSHHKITCDVSS